MILNEELTEETFWSVHKYKRKYVYSAVLQHIVCMQMIFACVRQLFPCGRAFLHVEIWLNAFFLLSNSLWVLFNAHLNIFVIAMRLYQFRNRRVRWKHKQMEWLHENTFTARTVTLEHLTNSREASFLAKNLFLLKLTQ